MTILLDSETCDLFVTQDGVPVLFRSLGKTADLTAADLGSEMEYTLTILEAEYGIFRVDALVVWHWGGEPSDVISEFGKTVPTEIRVMEFQSLPTIPEALAKRLLDPGDAGLNLAPAEWRTGERTVLLKKHLVMATIGVGAAAALWIGGLFLGVHIQQIQLGRLEAKEKELKEPARQAREMRTLLSLAEQYTNQTSSALECLLEVSRRKPADIEFREFTYDNRTNRYVEVRGDTTRPDAQSSVLDFENALRQSSLFRAVKLDGPRPKGNKHTFTIKMSLGRGKNEAVRP